MEITRRTLFESPTLQIDLFEGRPVSDACGDVERQSTNAVVLPLSGIFSKHDAPGGHVVGTPSHAVFFAADTPYRIGYPGGIGDRALTIRFGDEMAGDRIERRSGSATIASNGLLPANAMMLRNLLRARLAQGETGRFAQGDTGRFAIEALGLDLLDMSLNAMRTGDSPVRRSALTSRARALERVKEAVALAPADKWSVARLAGIANLSPFHLCHVFRQMVGTSLHDYVLHERLAQALDAVLDHGNGLTAVALDAGFAGHSHFTARFRKFFGCTPAALRRAASGGHVAELRKIVTAHRANRLS